MSDALAELRRLHPTPRTFSIVPGIVANVVTFLPPSDALRVRRVNRNFDDAVMMKSDTLLRRRVAQRLIDHLRADNAKDRKNRNRFFVLAFLMLFVMGFAFFGVQFLPALDTAGQPTGTTGYGITLGVGGFLFLLAFFLLFLLVNPDDADCSWRIPASGLCIWVPIVFFSLGMGATTGLAAYSLSSYSEFKSANTLPTVTAECFGASRYAVEDGSAFYRQPPFAPGFVTFADPANWVHNVSADFTIYYAAGKTTSSKTIGIFLYSGDPWSLPECTGANISFTMAPPTTVPPAPFAARVAMVLPFSLENGAFPFPGDGQVLRTAKVLMHSTFPPGLVSTWEKSSRYRSNWTLLLTGDVGEYRTDGYMNDFWLGVGLSGAVLAIALCWFGTVTCRVVCCTPASAATEHIAERWRSAFGITNPYMAMWGTDVAVPTHGVRAEFSGVEQELAEFRLSRRARRREARRKRRLERMGLRERPSARGSAVVDVSRPLSPSSSDDGVAAGAALAMPRAHDDSSNDEEDSDDVDVREPTSGMAGYREDSSL